MSKLRQKSEFNISASDILLKQNLYAHSVHCSYYSCFQLIKYTIKEFFDVNYEKQAISIATTKQKTHQYIVNFISSELIKFVGEEESRKFKRKVKDLKQYRTDSDYENIEVNSEKGNDAYAQAKEIRSYIIKNFNV